jgi:hypothetical protein
MKRIFILILIAVSTITFAQKNETSWLKKCTNITYHVNYNAIEYDFILDSLKATNDISFQWKITDPMNQSGRVKIMKPALDTATVLHNYFADSSNIILDNKTTVWVSKKVYKAIKKGGSIKIDPGLGREKLTFKNTEKLSAKLNGSNKSFNVLYAVTESGNKFWILDDPSNPVIMKMYLGWTIEVKEITTTK